MLSNVYIARGARGGTAVMKVGKTNNIRQRQRELSITIELCIPQPDATSALDLETQLRLFVLTQGGKRLPRTTDWFYFDLHIYTALCAVVAELNEEAASYTEIAFLPMEFSKSVAVKAEEDDDDAEIEALRKRYHRLLADEAERNAERVRRFQLENDERLKAAKAAKQERIRELQWKLDEQKAKFAEASERFCEEKDNPKEFLPKEIWELNWSVFRLENEIRNCGLSF